MFPSAIFAIVTLPLSSKPLSRTICIPSAVLPVIVSLLFPPASGFNPNILLSVPSRRLIPVDNRPPSLPGTPLILKTASVPPSTKPAIPKRLKREPPCKPRPNPLALLNAPLNPDLFCIWPPIPLPEALVAPAGCVGLLKFLTAWPKPPPVPGTFFNAPVNPKTINVFRKEPKPF